MSSSSRGSEVRPTSEEFLACKIFNAHFNKEDKEHYVHFEYRGLGKVGEEVEGYYSIKIKDQWVSISEKRLTEIEVWKQAEAADYRRWGTTDTASLIGYLDIALGFIREIEEFKPVFEKGHQVLSAARDLSDNDKIMNSDPVFSNLLILAIDVVQDRLNAVPALKAALENHPYKSRPGWEKFFIALGALALAAGVALYVSAVCDVATSIGLDNDTAKNVGGVSVIVGAAFLVGSFFNPPSRKQILASRLDALAKAEIEERDQEAKKEGVLQSK